MKRLVILISGRGSNLEAILEQIRAQGWPIQVVQVISNQPQAAGLEVARSYGVPGQALSAKDFADRDAYDRALAEIILRFQPDLVVLAGFMRILSPAFCQAFAGRLINIHPSLLPAFKGLDTHAQALASGVCVHGCTVHAVTPQLDHGPILAQAVVPVFPDDTVDQLATRVLEMEHQVYPLAIASILSGRFVLSEGRWIDRGFSEFGGDFSRWHVHLSL
jgi:phosphoribosylglycinamide formyltransferase-1